MAWEHVAAVPAFGESLVLVDGSLPRIRSDTVRLIDVLDAFEPLIGRPVFLRVGAEADLGGGERLRLLEFDSVVEVDGTVEGDTHAGSFARVVRELARRGEPETLVHGDFHRGNVTLVGGRAVIFDWSDACIGHQACDRVLFTDDYTDPVEAIPACLHQAASYLAIGERIAPDDRFWLGESTGFWRDRAVSLLA